MFDPEPQCRVDYATSFLRRAIQSVSEISRQIDDFTVEPLRVRPGSEVRLSGTLRAPFETIKSVQLAAGDQTAHDLLYNCITEKVLGTYRIPETSIAGPLLLEIAMNDSAGGSIILKRVSVTVDTAAPPSSFNPPLRRTPSVSSIMRDYPNLKIDSFRVGPNEHEGYILFDLRAKATP